LETQGEDLGGKIFESDPEVNRVGNATWRDYIKRKELLKEIAAVSIPATFINAGNDIRPNWPTRQLACLMPNGEYVEIEGAMHTIWLTHCDELKTALRKAIERFVAEQVAVENADNACPGLEP